MEAQQEKQTKANNVKKPLWEFEVDEMAYAKDFRFTGLNVVTEIVIERTSPFSYLFKFIPWQYCSLPYRQCQKKVQYIK